MMRSYLRCSVCGGSAMPIHTQNLPTTATPLSSKDDALKATDNYTIHKCDVCGLVQIPIANSTVGIFPKVLRSNSYSKEMMRFRDRQIKNFIICNKLKGKKILEIGCGDGENLRLIKKHGAIPVGLEGGRVLRNKEFSSSLENIDGFVSFNYLEHSSDINNLLDWLHCSTNSGVVGLIEVPDFEYMHSGGIYSEFIPEHNYYFTFKTLLRVLERNGFSIMNSVPSFGNYILGVMVKKENDQENTFKYIKEIESKAKKNVLKWFKKHGRETNVIYGAGHQAFSFINLNGIKDYVAYMVDDNPEKWGKYSPGSGIEICSPERLKKDKPNNVLVIAGSYDAEIFRKIRKMKLGHSVALYQPIELEE